MYLKEAEKIGQKANMAEWRMTDDVTQVSAMPEILCLYAFKPQWTKHLALFTEQVLRGPSPLSPGMRELIAAFTSSKNQCSF
jgi:alkylhydroperoxidase family enzyme